MRVSQEPNWRVPMLDPSRIVTPLEAHLTEAFTRVLRSGCYILGPEVSDFEREICRYLNVDHCIGVSSGTDALLVALMAAGIGAGDEVITSPLTFVATAEAILRVRATPVFADICPSCLCLDPSSVAEAIGTKTKAVLAVDLYGQLGHIEQLGAVTRDAGIVLLEDACQAFGAKQKGRAAGTFGLAGCFSFFPSKTLGGFGDGGVVVTNDPGFADTVRALRAHGSRNKHTYARLGGNFRIDAMHAALLKVLLPYIDEWLLSRGRLALTYSQSLASIPCVSTPKICEGADSAWSVYALRVPGHRDALKAHLAQCGIETAVYYPNILSQQPMFEGNSRVCGELAIANEASRCVLSLPLFPGLQALDQAHVVGSITQYFATLAPNELAREGPVTDAAARRNHIERVIIGP